MINSPEIFNLSEYLSKKLGIPFAIIQGIKMLLYSMFAFLSIDLDIIDLLKWLVILDMTTGVIKTVRIKELKFSLHRFWSGLLAKCVLVLIPVTLALVLKAFVNDASNFVDGVLKLIILTEGISVFVNLMSIHKRKEIESQDYLYLIMKMIRRFFDKRFQQILKNKYNDEENTD